jgi:phosphoribosyl 1,2-cyclic phosphodiesterase
MPLQFAVLASGSRGNSTLIQAGGPGLLIDVGLPHRKLARRLASVGCAWESVGCALLTHTHGDHLDNSSLLAMSERGIALCCHEEHMLALRQFPGYITLERAGLVRTYDERPFLAPNGLRVEPIPLSHDGGATFGFRIEGKTERRGGWLGLGFMADTGRWSEAMVEALAGAALLAIEFNHDVELQRGSGRAPFLIERILGDEGHLSNEQGASLLQAVLERSKPGPLRHVVLLHMSEQCNRPDLALEAAHAAVRASGRRAEVMVGQQHTASPDLRLPQARIASQPQLDVATPSAAPEPVASAAS